MVGAGGVGPRGVKLFTRRVHGGTENVPSPSPVPQILWELERESRRLSEPQFPHLPNGGNIIASKFSEELFRG